MSARKSETLKFTSTISSSTKNSLSPDEADLCELAQLAGVAMDPKVFKILLDLLQMNVAPMAIERMLRSMSASTGSQRHSSSTSASANSDLRTPTGNDTPLIMAPSSRQLNVSETTRK